MPADDTFTVESLKLSVPEKLKQNLRSIEELKKSEVFAEGLGLVRDFEAKLILKDGAQPVFMKSRQLPYAVKEMVHQELKTMADADILEKVEYSEWATPIVVVRNKNKIRICGDYKVTLNRVIETKHYPIPSVEECLNTVVGGSKFTVLDIKKAYNNLLIRSNDRKFTTINTPFGLFEWKRLPYGISNSGPIFQENIDHTLQGIPMTTCRVDDILISGKTDKEHLYNLNYVIMVLEYQGYRCNWEKSQIFRDRVVYLGHEVSQEGIRPLKSKVDDLLGAKTPENVGELVSFLGAVNYYRRYLPQLSTVISPLERLRSKDVKWQWTAEEEEAYKKLKKMLSSEIVLTFYNPELPVKLDTDASSVGLGAVLSHIMPNGEERPIEFISRTLSAAERNYAQIDREALGIVWGVKRFHLYLYGRKFLLRTDHKPLVHIFGAKKMPDMGTSRIIRWALFLMEYDYEIIYRKTSEHSNCDMLSRLPVTTKHTEDEDLNAVVCALNLETTCIDAETIRVETKKDPVLSKIATFILDGWPITSPDSELMIAYWRRKDELSMELGCVLWGARVIIPTKLKQFVLEMLHLTHPGSPGMKNLARSYVWWPSMNNDIDNLVRTCETCSKHSKSAPTVGEHPWSKPQGPWQRVHMDFAGPFAGFMWLVLQCAYSKWPEVAKMQSTSAPKLIKELRNIFARTGIPCVCVSDNGPQFTSDTLDKFMKTNRIKHILTPTYHPKSNGLAERLVGSFKHSMKKMLEENGDVDQNMSNFLLRYRNTPHSKTRIEPAVLMYGRTLRSALHFIRPSDRERAELLQADKEQKVADELPKVRQFHPKQLILVQKNDNKTWSKGVVMHDMVTPMCTTLSVKEE